MKRRIRSGLVLVAVLGALHIGTGSYEIGDAMLALEFSQGLDLMVGAARPRMSAEASACGAVSCPAPTRCEASARLLIEQNQVILASYLRAFSGPAFPG